MYAYIFIALFLLLQIKAVAQEGCTFVDVTIQKSDVESDTFEFSVLFLFSVVQDREFEFFESVCEIEIYKGTELKMKYYNKFPFSSMLIEKIEGDKLIFRFPNIKECIEVEIDRSYNTIEIIRKNNKWRVEYYDGHIDFD